MLGKTHFVLGMASALIITQPQTIPGVITAMTGGALGGWIVDEDLKNRDVEQSEEAHRENIYDTIIDGIFILAFIAVDFFTGRGMCQYVIDNWGVKVWGALFGILILLLIGINTKHRTFTHSFLAMALFSGAVFFFCRPAAIPFLIGYASHIISDYFNKLGLQLFFPLKWRPCLKLCRSDKKANRVLFWVSLAIDITLGAFLFSRAMAGVDATSNIIAILTGRKLFGLNVFQLYLIFINIITFLGFQRSHKAFMNDLFNAYEKGAVYKDEDYETPELRFATWLLDIMVFLGGGVGMLVSLLIHLELPAAYNGNWWAFCYTSIMFWFTVYCYICNPFGLQIRKISWLDAKHIPLLVYLLGINIVSALVLYSWRKKKFKENDIKHTIILLLGALGGTIGSIPTVFLINRAGKYYYIVMGFCVMLISQIVFVMYMMSVGAF